jgi:peptidyl-prolyl cis-trans isomerase D
MLQQIRKTVAHSIILKIFLGAIIVSFVAWGVSDMLRGPSNQDMVTFNDLDPITYGDFTKEKALAAKRASQDGSTNPTEEGLETQDLSTIQNLITNKLLEYVAKLYDIEFSDTVAVNFIKSLEIFRNDNNEFDVEKFKNILKNEGYTETEYSKQIKNMMTRGTVMSSLIGNEYIPNKRIGNIVAHMSEIRTIDVASIPLSIKAKTQNTNFIDNDLKNFYNEHQDIFKSNELRDICYTKIDPTVVSHGITISDEEIKNFFTENKTDFANQTLKVASAQIKKTLLQTKINSSLVDISKELEDEVAGGSTLSLIHI